jgi:glyoxylase I family protein
LRILHLRPKFNNSKGDGTICLMFKGLEHTAIASPDPPRLAQWYVDNLEFVVNHVYEGNYFVKAANGAVLEIIPSAGERAVQGPKDPGLRHLAVLVDDFDGARERLARQGVRFAGEPFSIGTNRLVFFHDLDGNLLHLIRRETPLP